MAFFVNPSSKIERAVRSLLILQGDAGTDAAAFQANGDIFVANDSRVRTVLPNRTIYCSSFTPERPYRPEGRCRFQIEHRFDSTIQTPPVPTPSNPAAAPNPAPVPNFEQQRVIMDNYLGDTLDTMNLAGPNTDQALSVLADAITTSGRWLATPDPDPTNQIAAQIVANNMDMANFRCDWVKFATPFVSRGKAEGDTVVWIEILNFEAYISHASIALDLPPLPVTFTNGIPMPNVDAYGQIISWNVVDTVLGPGVAKFTNGAWVWSKK